MEVRFDDDAEEIECQGCGEKIPAFLDGCPYCDESDGEDVDDVVGCPSCGAEIHAESQRCPVCGDWVTPGRKVVERRNRAWLVIGVAVIITAILISLMRLL